MPNRLDSWLGVTPALTDWMDQSIQQDYGRIWKEKEVEITILRDGVALNPQAVRIETIDNVPFERFGSGKTAFINGTRIRIYGYKDHPSIANTDIQFLDRFKLADQTFEVLQVQPSETWLFTAIAEARD